MENKEKKQAVTRSDILQKYIKENRLGTWLLFQWETKPIRLVGYLLLGGTVFFLLLYFIPVTIFRNYSIGIAIEFASVALTVLIIDALTQKRLNEQLKKQLILQMGSKHNDLSLSTIRTLRAFGWGFEEDKTLQNAKLLKANLQDADLDHVNLQEANLKMADLRRATLNQALLQNAILYKANLEGAYLNQADLLGALLNRAKLQSASLNKTNLRKSRLDKADLQGASLFEANLQGASMNETYLQGAGLGGSNLCNAHMYRANLRKARLGTADLRKVNLGEANLQEAHLYRANLEEAILYGADLRGANLREANLKGAILYGADLRGATGLTLKQLMEVKTLSGTILPDESSPEELALTLFGNGKIDEASFNNLIKLGGIEAKSK